MKAWSHDQKANPVPKQINSSVRSRRNDKSRRVHKIPAIAAANAESDRKSARVSELLGAKEPPPRKNSARTIVARIIETETRRERNRSRRSSKLWISPVE